MSRLDVTNVAVMKSFKRYMVEECLKPENITAIIRIFPFNKLLLCDGVNDELTQ